MRTEKLYAERAKRSPKQDDSRYPFGLLGIVDLMDGVFRRPRLVRVKRGKNPKRRVK